MKVKKFIWELIKFGCKNGNLGIVRWQQYAGFVNVTGFEVKDNKVIVTYKDWANVFIFNIFDKNINSLIKDLIKILYKHGNLSIEMFWDESDSDNCRTGYLPITSLNIVNNGMALEIA